MMCVCDPATWLADCDFRILMQQCTVENEKWFFGTFFPEVWQYLENHLHNILEMPIQIANTTRLYSVVTHVLGRKHWCEKAMQTAEWLSLQILVTAAELLLEGDLCAL